MAVRSKPNRRLAAVATAGVLALGLCTVSTSAALAATAADGVIELGAAETFGVLGASAVTNTGPTIVDGDVGVSPGTSITGFEGPPAGLVNGTLHATDAVAGQAQSDLTGAIDDAAGLPPTTSGLANLSGLSLTPGVYSGGELSLNSGGLLTLAGTADSIWVFQASSTLTIGSAAQIQLTGGATSCNVFWQVSSSATIGTGAQFVGTVMAGAAITANTGATIQGRLLANGTAVTLDTNRITAPTGCDIESPEFTSSDAPGGTVGTPYTHTVAASGSPTPTYTITDGTLPAGLVLDETTGIIAGTPTTPGTYEVTVSASNGVAPAATQVVTIVVSAPAVPTTDAPVPTTDAPVPTTDAPVPTTDAPIPTTDAPIPTTDAQVPTTDAPAPTTDAPTITAGAPTGGAGTPTNAAGLPVTGGGNDVSLAVLGGSLLLLGGLALLIVGRLQRRSA